MTKMKTIAYSFWAGAALYLFFAVSILLSINTGYVSIVLSVVALTPVVLYLRKCPSAMPIKNSLRFFVFVSVICGTALSIYSRVKLSSLGYNYSPEHALFYQLNKLFWDIYYIVIMTLEATISWQLVKMSRTFSYIWWASIFIFVLAFRPLWEMVIAVSINNSQQYVTYLNLLYILRNIGYTLLFTAIGLFFRPTAK
jgi:hypothetical protein